MGGADGRDGSGVALLAAGRRAAPRGGGGVPRVQAARGERCALGHRQGSAGRERGGARGVGGGAARAHAGGGGRRQAADALSEGAPPPAEGPRADAEELEDAQLDPGLGRRRRPARGRGVGRLGVRRGGRRGDAVPGVPRPPPLPVARQQRLRRRLPRLEAQAQGRLQPHPHRAAALPLHHSDRPHREGLRRQEPALRRLRQAELRPLRRHRREGEARVAIGRQRRRRRRRRRRVGHGVRRAKGEGEEDQERRERQAAVLGDLAVQVLGVHLGAEGEVRRPQPLRRYVLVRLHPPAARDPRHAAGADVDVPRHGVPAAGVHQRARVGQLVLDAVPRLRGVVPDREERRLVFPRLVEPAGHHYVLPHPVDRRAAHHHVGRLRRAWAARVVLSVRRQGELRRARSRRRTTARPATAASASARR